MGRNSGWWSSKVSLILLGLLFAGFPREAYPQELRQLDSIATGTIDKASIDQQGYLYLCDRDGQVFKYGAEGKITVNYSPTKSGRITQIDAWQGLRVMIFYADFQELVILDRFLTATEPYSLYNDEIGFVRTATMSNDDNVWILDDSDYSLKKLDVERRSLFQNTSFSYLLSGLDTDFNFLREYKNLLYLNDRNSGVMVFDNLGNFIERIDIPGLDFLSFWGDEMYYLKQGSIHFHHLYQTTRRELALPSDEDFKFALIAQDRLYLIAGNYFKVYQLP